MTPLEIIYTDVAVIIGMVYTLLPFMILPLYASFEKFDKRLIEAAHDLGANKTTVMMRIIIPLVLPGIIAGISSGISSIAWYVLYLGLTGRCK